MSDIYIRDASRILLDTPIGRIQAWGAASNDTSVSMSFYADIKYAETDAAYIYQALNLRSADARKLASALVIAADHADKVRTDNPTPLALGEES